MNIGTIQDIGSVVTSSVPRAQNTVQHGQAATATPAANTQSQPSKETSSQSNNSTAAMPLEEAVSRLESFVSSSTDANINFSIDEASGMRVVKVVDPNTQETIRQIPSEEAISLAMALDKLKGLFVQEKA